METVFFLKTGHKSVNKHPILSSYTANKVYFSHFLAIFKY